MRRTLGLLAAVGLLASIFPATVAADAAVRASSSQTQMICELTTTAGPASVFLQIDGTQPFAFVAIWAPDDSPIVVSVQTDATFDGTNLTAQFDLVDPNSGEPLGTADLTAVMKPDGPVQDFDSRDIRNGNQWIRLVQTIQPLDVEGSLVLDLRDASETLDLGPCGASTFIQSEFATNPNAWLSGTDQVFISCEWVSERGSVSLLAIADDFDTLTQVVSIQGDRAFVGLTVPTLTESAFEAAYDVFDPETRETVGSATATATLSPSGDRITENRWEDPYRLRTTGERLSVHGTLTIDIMGASTRLVMDDMACRAGDVRIQVMQRIPHG